MEVFISWSGPRSEAAATALRNWLPKIINALQPWLSNADIDKGARWSADVAQRLASAKAGIICLTPSNLRADWILFESGALSKTLQHTFVCPLLIGIEPSDVKGPLAQFQATQANKKDILALLMTLNSALGESMLSESHIDEVFEVWWPRLEADFAKLPADESSVSPHRPDRELLEEILGLVRSQGRSTAEPMPLKERIQVIHKKIGNILSLRGIGTYSTSTRLAHIDLEYTDVDGKNCKYSFPFDLQAEALELLIRQKVLGSDEGPINELDSTSGGS
jgi:hypothetical protein